MILFAFGIFVGILLSILVALIAFISSYKGYEPLKMIQTSAKNLAAPKGAIINPPSDTEYARQLKIQDNEANNLDTVLDDLLS